MILTVIPIDKYNLFRDCDFVNPLEIKKYISKKKKKKKKNFMYFWTLPTL